MGSDTQNRRWVEALWRLVEAGRSRVGAGFDATAQDAAMALQGAMADEEYLILHEDCGRIFVDAHLVSFGVDVFVAAKGLAGRMQARGVGELLFQRGVSSDDLGAWAKAFASDGFLVPKDGRIHVGVRTQASEPTFQLGRRQASAEAGDSRLRAVYLENQLMSMIDERHVPPDVARCVLHGIVDCLLRVDGGLEPLTLLQRVPSALSRALHVAIVTVQMASVGGWPQSHLGQLGAIALMHDIGAVLDPGRSAAASLYWLLDRGTDEFWLRAACVAAGWREPAMGPELGRHDLMATDLVRLAVCHCERAFGGLGPADPSSNLLARLAAAGAAALAAAAPHS